MDRRPTDGRVRMPSDDLRRGDVVEVKDPAAILATLDERGALEELPFMPEMAAFCGRRFEVERRAERVCDTVHYTGSRKPPRSVLLAAPRRPPLRRLRPWRLPGRVPVHLEGGLAAQGRSRVGGPGPDPPEGEGHG